MAESISAIRLGNFVPNSLNPYYRSIIFKNLADIKRLRALFENSIAVSGSIKGLSDQQISDFLIGARAGMVLVQHIFQRHGEKFDWIMKRIRIPYSVFLSNRTRSCFSL